MRRLVKINIASVVVLTVVGGVALKFFGVDRLIGQRSPSGAELMTPQQQRDAALEMAFQQMAIESPGTSVYLEVMKQGIVDQKINKWMPNVVGNQHARAMGAGDVADRLATEGQFTGDALKVAAKSVSGILSTAGGLAINASPYGKGAKIAGALFIAAGTPVADHAVEKGIDSLAKSETEIFKDRTAAAQANAGENTRIYLSFLNELKDDQRNGLMAHLFKQHGLPANPTNEQLHNWVSNKLVERETKAQQSPLSPEENAQLRTMLKDALNGQAKPGDEKKLEELVTKSLAPLQDQMAKDRKAYSGLLNDIRDDQKKVADEQERIRNEQIKEADFQKMAAGAQSTVFIVSSILKFSGNPQFAQQVSVVGSGVVEIATAYRNFTKNLSSVSNLSSILKDGLSTAIFSGNILSVGMKIFGAFFGGPPPLNQLEIIKAQLKNIKVEIVSLRADMRNQFAMLDVRMDQAFARMEARMEMLAEGQKAISNEVAAVAEMISDMQFSLRVLDYRLASKMTAMGHRLLIDQVSPCLNFKNDWPSRSLSEEKFYACVNAAKVYATTHSRDAIATRSTDPIDFENTDVLGVVSQEPEAALGWMASFLSKWSMQAGNSKNLWALEQFSEIPNPIEWWLGAQSLIELGVQYPELYRRASPKLVGEVIESGYEIKNFLTHLALVGGDQSRPRKDVYADLLKFYRKKADDFGKRVDVMRLDFEALNNVKGYDFAKNEVEKTSYDPFQGKLTLCSGGITYPQSYKYQDGRQDGGGWDSVRTVDYVKTIDAVPVPPRLLEQINANIIALQETTAKAGEDQMKLKGCVKDLKWRMISKSTNYYRRSDAAFPKDWPAKKQPIDKEGTITGWDHYYEETKFKGKPLLTIALKVVTEKGELPYKTIRFEGPEVDDYQVIEDPGDFAEACIERDSEGVVSPCTPPLNNNNRPKVRFNSREEAQAVADRLCQGRTMKKLHPNGPHFDKKFESCLVLAASKTTFAVMVKIPAQGEKHRPNDDLNSAPLREDKVYQVRNIMPETYFKGSGIDWQVGRQTDNSQEAAIESIAVAIIGKRFEKLRKTLIQKADDQLKSGSLAKAARDLDGAKRLLLLAGELSFPRLMASDKARATFYSSASLPDTQSIRSASALAEGKKDVPVIPEYSGREPFMLLVDEKLKAHAETFEELLNKSSLEADGAMWIDPMLESLGQFQLYATQDLRKSNVSEIFALLVKDVDEAVAKVPRKK